MSKLGSVALAIGRSLLEHLPRVVTVSVDDDAAPLRSDSGLVRASVGCRRGRGDAIPKRPARDKLSHKATHDPLTGLLNRVGFRQHIDRVLDPGRSRGSGVGLLSSTWTISSGQRSLRATTPATRPSAKRHNVSRRPPRGVRRRGPARRRRVRRRARRRRRADVLRAAERRIRAAFDEPFMLGEVQPPYRRERGWKPLARGRAEHQPSS